jgi:hypothetical protein
MLNKRLMASAAVVACSGSLGVLTATGAAAAPAGTRTIQQTFPAAEQLCTNVADGRGGARLRDNASQVLADCGALQTAFTNAHTLFGEAEALDASIVSESAAANARCGRASKAVRAACIESHASAVALVRSLRAKRGALNATAWSDVKAARAAFWAAISSLPRRQHTASPVRRAKRVVTRRVVVVVREVRAHVRHTHARHAHVRRGRGDHRHHKRAHG